MKSFLHTLVPVLLALVIIPLVSCNSSPTSTTPAAISFTDQLGRTVTLDSVPQRLISMSPADTEILFALGLGDRVVAVTEYCDYPPETAGKPTIGGFYNPNIEEIVALSPDLVFAAPIHKDQVIPQLEAKGIKVLAVTPVNVEQVLEAIILVGQVTGVEKTAKSLTANMRQRIQAVTDKTAGLTTEERPEVLYLVWHDPLYAAGANTFHDELIKMAGGVNMVTEPDYPGINLETVIEASPDIILAGIGMGEGGDAPLIFAREEARLRETSARQHNRVHGVDSEIVDRSGPRLVDALEEFARLIHPELFE
jgi:iron complex transport system substrate-binding protein